MAKILTTISATNCKIDNTKFQDQMILWKIYTGDPHTWVWTG